MRVQPPAVAGGAMSSRVGGSRRKSCLATNVGALTVGDSGHAGGTVCHPLHRKEKRRRHEVGEVSKGGRGRSESKNGDSQTDLQKQGIRTGAHKGKWGSERHLRNNMAGVKGRATRPRKLTKFNKSRRKNSIAAGRECLPNTRRGKNRPIFRKDNPLGRQHPIRTKKINWCDASCLFQ